MYRQPETKYQSLDIIVSGYSHILESRRDKECVFMGKFKAGVKKVLSRIIVGLMVSLMLLNSAYIVVMADDSTSNYSMIGTQAALNSPVLNSGFTTDSWNKWEMVCWGVFLSNFCVPFVDTYQTAFSSGSNGGSNGAGYKALVFGGGSDTGTTETIKGLADYAINQQTQAMPRTIYVSWSPIEGNSVKLNDLNTVLANDTTAVAEELAEKADMKDLLLSEKDYTVSGKIVEVGNTAYASNTPGVTGGELPTFWILEDGVFVKVLDYTDAYDIQLPGLALARAYKSDYYNEAQENLKEWIEGEAQLGLDSFGNIVTFNGYSQYVIIPAAANQNLTTNKSINLVNSLIMNGYEQTMDSTSLKLKGEKVEDHWWSSDKPGTHLINGKISDLEDGSVVVYYSGETVSYQDANGISTVGSEANVIRELFECDITKQYPKRDNGTNRGAIGSNNYQFIMQPVGIKGADFYKASFWSGMEHGIENGITNLTFRINAFVNTLSKNTSTKTLTEIQTPNSGVLSLFDTPTVVAYRYRNGYTKGKMNRSAALRNWYNLMYTVYSKGYKTTHGDVTSAELKGFIDSSTSVKELNEKLMKTGAGKVSGFLGAYYLSNQALFSIENENEKFADVDVKNGTDFTKPSGIVGDAVKAKYDTGENLVAGAIDSVNTTELALAYPISETMMNVGNVLGVREGTQFSVYSAYIYMTYLDWYGITKKIESSDTMGESSTKRAETTSASNFDTRIFNENSEVLLADINDIASIRTDEDKQKELLEYNYLMMHPTAGRSYRSTIIKNWLTDFLYDNYQKLVYGNASDSYSSISGVTTSGSSSGFLSIDTYKENVFTAWFLKIYADTVVKVAGFLLITIVVFGLITRKKVTWFIVSGVVMINALLVIPSLGDITPYVANNMITNMFQDKMSYWAVSEAVYNESIKVDYKKNQSLVSSTDSGVDYASVEDVADGLKLIQDLSTLYTDRALMLKQDISQKVTEKLDGNYAEIQNMQTTRWLLPTIIQQFTANDEKDLYNYVLEPLSDELQSARNLYYWYKPDQNPDQDKLHGDDYANTEGGSDYISDADKGALEGHIDSYEDYVNISAQISAQGSLTEYYSKAYDYHASVMDMPHSIFYYVKNGVTLASREDSVNQDRYDNESWNDYALSALGTSSTGFVSLADDLEAKYNTYEPTKLLTMKQQYGYLWATESPLAYMYCSVRDSFPSVCNMSFIAGQLVGSYEDYEVTDSQGNVLKDSLGQSTMEKRRVNFMYAPDTEYIRDVLDLQEMFTNMLPYLYQMELTACGPVNGTTGVLQDTKIKNGIYEGALQSWFFRSNWVTKLMENKDYATKGKVTDKDGNVYEVPNMIVPTTYPDERPMIFSEAQMHEMGLTEYDLNIVELKCINTNKEVCGQWNYLINYVNLNNMTKDIMFEQMALEATMVFNEQFSPTGFTNGRYKMYPTTIDLRSLSFDSIMKMLVMNSTKDAAYVYGDTMKGLLTNSDIVTAILLLLTAFVNAMVIPLTRNFILAAIFFLGLWAVIKVIMSDAKTQFNVSCGWFISNVVFLVMTIVFYAIFDALAYINSADEVLTANSIQAQAGSPIWVILITLAASVTYAVGMFKLMKFCFQHRRDMGMEAYSTIARQAASKISDGVGRISSSIQRGTTFFGAEYSSTSASDGHGKKDVTKGGKRRKNRADDEFGYSINNEAYSGGSTVYGSSDSSTVEDYRQKEYSSYKEVKDDFESNTDDINKAIERGRNKEESKSTTTKEVKTKETKVSKPAPKDTMMKL